MDQVTEDRLKRDWQDVWEKIETANTYEEHRRATAPMDNLIESLAERFESTLDESQARVFKMLMDLRVQRDLTVQVEAENHYFKLGYLAGCGELDQIPEALVEYPADEAQAIAGVLIDDNAIKRYIDDLSKILAT